tara:strand:+ start:7487 stop:8479 length:993 start_codon:yes stop_codon:yes gene_type:complete
MTNSLIEQARAAAAAAKLTDQTKDTGGGFEYTPPPAGKAAARFVGYVELGKRDGGEYNGKPKPDALVAYLFFELMGKKYQQTFGEGDDAITRQHVLRERVQVKSGERANFTKLLKKMTYGRSGITHMALMLGEAFLINISHNEVGEGKDKKVYANMRTPDDGWTIGAPMYDANKDPLGEPDMQPIAVPEPSEEIKLLLWDAPTKEQWDSLFIDGTRTVKDEKGQESEVSRNWLQEDIVKSAKDFEGSALQVLIMEQGGMVLDGGEAAAKKPDGKTSTTKSPSDGEAAKKPVESQEPDPAPDTPEDAGDVLGGPEDASSDDPLADLGLDLD